MSAQQILRYFAYQHLPARLQVVSQSCHDLAYRMARTLPDGDELADGLRNLLRAKDSFVRAALDAPTDGVHGSDDITEHGTA